MKKLLFFFFILTPHLPAEKFSLDDDWRFIDQDVPQAQAPTFNAQAWRSLDLPHDWSIEGDYKKDHPMGAQCGYLPAGIAWYRKTIQIKPEWKGKHIEIAFDGAFMQSTVWANGKELGHRPYGWSSFSYDLSALAETSDHITISVRIDNQKQPSARWYTGSGIYGHTWLVVKDKLHLQENGIFIRTQQNTVTLDAEVANTSTANHHIEIETLILDPQGKEVTSRLQRMEISTGKTKTARFSLDVPAPQRWDINTPNLYTAQTRILRGGKMIDEVNTRFGIRDIEWKPETGMWINGRKVKLRGICNHQDAGALGTAPPDKLIRFRIRQLKAMGCNAIRTAHNPRTPIFYDICDEEGMLVMDEIFDGWNRKAEHDYGAHHFTKWWRTDLRDWMRRDRNHPCVVIWSVGNETGGSIGKDIVELCHRLDPTRPVTSGHASSHFMDVYGVNGSSEMTNFWTHHRPKNKVFIGTENTHTWQVRGFYRAKTWFRDGFPAPRQHPFPCPDLTPEEIFTYDWTENQNKANHKQVFNSSYDNAMVRMTTRKNLEQIRDIPQHAGSFRWTGHDYLGEAGYVHGGWPFKAFMGGAIDMANFEKDLYYLYQSQWTEQPMVHILPHWTHPVMKPGTMIPVQVYSNTQAVEIFHNGTSLGRKSPGKAWNEMQCQWMIPWEPGTLRAVGYRAGKKVAEKIIRTAEHPTQLALSIDGEPLNATGKDLVQVRVTTQDAKGEFYPYGENRTWFHVIGPARIKALDNGSPIDVEPHVGPNHRIAFFGLTRAYIESLKNETAPITLLAASILGEKKQVTSQQVSIDTQLLALRGDLAKPEIAIHYTTEGTAPTASSPRYIKPFSVPLGSTVKALVLLDGKPTLQLEERFAQDVGFVWHAGNQDRAAPPSGLQAELAKRHQAPILSTEKGFRGSGYIHLEKQDSYAEWYQENDGDARQAKLMIRYHLKTSPSTTGHHIRLIINDQAISPDIPLPASVHSSTRWRVTTVPIPLSRGANRIRIKHLPAPSQGSLYLDEITIK